jgi:hypothetical protein
MAHRYSPRAATGGFQPVEIVVFANEETLHYDL